MRVNGIYEITNIERHTGALEADSMRIGKRYVIYQMDAGLPAILVHQDDAEKALITTPVQSIEYHGIHYIDIKTRTTTYELMLVVDRG